MSKREQEVGAIKIILATSLYGNGIIRTDTPKLATTLAESLKSIGYKVLPAKSPDQEKLLSIVRIPEDRISDFEDEFPAKPQIIRL